MKGTLSTLLYIVYSGEASDRAVAETVAAALDAAPFEPILVTADELVRRHKDVVAVPQVAELSPFLRSVLGRLPGIATAVRVLHGMVVVLLSEAMVRDGDRRDALLAATGALSRPEFRRYYVCLRCTPQELRNRFPDLAAIYENVMVHGQEELAAVIADVRSRPILAHPGFLPAFRSGARSIFGTLFNMILVSVGKLHRWRFLLAAAVVVALYVDASSKGTIALTMACCYAIGVGLSRIEPLDAWPWLARCWKWSADLDPVKVSQTTAALGPITLAGVAAGLAIALLGGGKNAAAYSLFAGFVAQGVVDIACVAVGSRRFRRQRAAHPPEMFAEEETCDPAEPHGPYRSLTSLRIFNILYVFFPLLVMVFVGTAAAIRFSWTSALLCVAAFTLGALAPAMSAVLWLTATGEAMRHAGVTTEFLQRARKDFRGGRKSYQYPLGIDDTDLASFTGAQKADLRGFVFLQRMVHVPSVRRWSRAPDYAFISYAWGDAQKLDAAARLDDSLEAADIRYFHDTRAIVDPFAVFREHLSSALMRCTHFFLIVSPGIRNAPVVLREIETVLQRWYIEMLPAVICVVRPEEWTGLRDGPEVPLSVRYLLTCCPQMTVSEASDPRRVRYVVEHTRRNGKWSDWLATLSPPAARFRIARMPGLVR